MKKLALFCLLSVTSVCVQSMDPNHDKNNPNSPYNKNGIPKNRSVSPVPQRSDSDETMLRIFTVLCLSEINSAHQSNVSSASASASAAQVTRLTGRSTQRDLSFAGFPRGFLQNGRDSRLDRNTSPERLD